MQFQELSKISSYNLRFQKFFVAAMSMPLPEALNFIEFTPVIFGSCAAILCLIFFFRQSKKSGIPRVKDGLPFFGQVFNLLKESPWDTMTSWAYKYGLTYRFHFFGSEGVVVADPKLLKVVLSTKMSSFNKDTKWTYKPFMSLLGGGLVTSEGSEWRRQRTLLSQTLRIHILEEIPNMAFRAVQRLSIKLDEVLKTGSVIEMAEEFRHLTLQVISEAVLSIDSDESDRTFAKMYLPIVTEGNLRTWSPHRMYIPTPSWFQFRKDVKKLNDYVTDIIRKRWDVRIEEINASSDRRSSRKRDVLDVTISGWDPTEWNESSLRQVRDEVKTFILAGHETSASMLTWTLFELSRNKDLLERARAEAESVFGPSSRNGGGSAADILSRVLASPPSVTTINTLTFIHNCLKETLRRYSVVPVVVRIANERIHYESITISKGATVMILMQAVHHNPDIWKDQLVYNHDRFLQEPKPFTFLPFIDGPRNCLGQHLSLLESKIVIALLILCYDFQVVNQDATEKHPFMVPITTKTGHFMKVF